MSETTTTDKFKKGDRVTRDVKYECNVEFPDASKAHSVITKMAQDRKLWKFKTNNNMRTKFANLLKPALLIGAVMCCFSCQKYKPELKYPVVYIDTSEQKHARWSEPVKTIILKDANGELQELYTQRGYYDRWTDSIYQNCQIGDTIK